MSLRWKLVVMYAAAVATVVAAFSAAVVWAMRNSLERSVATEVAAQAHAVGALVEFEDGAWGIESPGIDAQFADGSGLYYQVADAKGAVLLASPLARTLSPVSSGDGERMYRVGDRRLLEVTTTVTKVSDEEKTPPTSLVVLCGKDLGEVDDTVSALVALLAWLGPLVSALALLGGLFLAGRALRPIDQIARTAAAIGEHDLTHRIPVHGRDELAMLAATLNSTFDRLQSAFERQVRFTADASHELRTPLAAIVGNLELLLGRPRSPDEMRNLLQDMRTSANQMHELMEGLLTLARADHGVAAGGDRVCLAPLGEQVLQEMADETREHRVALRLAATAAPDVTGDRDCLRRLLRNLVRNAVRYNRPGGQVVVHVGADAHAAWLEVEDDGIGIPAAALPHLGERFYRVDSSRTRSTGGVGLGLSIVKAIVAAHRGQFEIRSVEGEGTRVKVSFPLAS